MQMNELKIIQEQEILGKPFTVYGDFENPLFLAKEVAEWIEHSDMTRMVSLVDEDEKLKRTIYVSGQNREMWFLTEDGVYEVLMQSRKPIAKQFKKEVKAVLKSIRKHGAYMTPEKLEEVLLNPDTMIKLCTALKEEQNKNKTLQLQNAALSVDNQIMKPKADYFDELVERGLDTGIRETAKELHIKERKFVKFLTEKKYLYRDKKGKLQPYSNYVGDLFTLKECFNEGTGWKGLQLLVTPKGKETFKELYLAAL